MVVYYKMDGVELVKVLINYGNGSKTGTIVVQFIVWDDRPLQQKRLSWKATHKIGPKKAIQSFCTISPAFSLFPGTHALSMGNDVRSKLLSGYRGMLVRKIQSIQRGTSYGGAWQGMISLCMDQVCFFTPTGKMNQHWHPIVLAT